MNKFFMLMLSAAAICGTSPVFAMDPPDQFNEDYHRLPTLSVDIHEELNHEKLELLKRQIFSPYSYLTFKDKNGFVYTIDDNFPNSYDYLSANVAVEHERFGQAKYNHPHIDLMEDRVSCTGDSITHNYVDANRTRLWAFEPQSIVFRKKDLRGYLKSPPPSFDGFNERYHQLPTILVDIQEELNFEKLKTLKRQIRTSPSYLTFKDKNGFVYTIDDNFPNSCGYLSQKIVERWGHTKHPLIDLMITKLSYTNDCITHNYVGAKEPQLYIVEPESIVFKKIDLRQYLQSSSPSFDSRSVPLSEVIEYLERSRRKS